jgi:hypothetical protein
MYTGKLSRHLDHLAYTSVCDLPQSADTLPLKSVFPLQIVGVFVEHTKLY